MIILGGASYFYRDILYFDQGFLMEWYLLLIPIIGIIIVSFALVGIQTLIRNLLNNIVSKQNMAGSQASNEWNDKAMYYKTDIEHQADPFDEFREEHKKEELAKKSNE